mmetsp:Transcript_48824/g.117612  ORF Transcript_48824/g.117612 Transcript_48824/m.117612 type:complete len:241 (-) Transcript_48824:1095-1817(-)
MADDDGGGVDQTARELHLLDAWHRLDHPRAQRIGSLAVESPLGGGALCWRRVEVELSLLGRDERLAAVVHQVGHHEFVNRRVEQQHLEVLGLERLHVGRGEGTVARGRQQVVELLLLRAHPAHVVIKRDEFSRLAAGGLEAEQLCGLLLVGEVGVHPLLDELAELCEELEVLGRVLLCVLAEEAHHPPREDAGELSHEGRVLHGLARDVEWQVLAVYHALKEAHPLGEQCLALGLDEDLA